MKQVLWISDLVAPTGFSRVSHSLIKRLKQDFQIVGLGINYSGDPHRIDIPIFPAHLGGDLWGFNRLLSIVQATNPDLIFILNDVWVVDKYLSILKKANVHVPIVVYFPVDAERHFSIWYENFDIVTRAFTYTKFGVSVVSSVWGGKIEVIPHGVDKGVFYRAFQSRKEAKEVLFGDSARADEIVNSVIFLNANRNQPRKALDLTLEAFKIFSEGKSDVFLYMHCGNIDADHINLELLAAKLGISQKILTTLDSRGNYVSGIQRIPDLQLNLIYNAADVGINTSYGEGWGLPNFEHAITGAPQIVPDHSACRELFLDCGLLTPLKTKIMLPGGTMTLGGMIDVEALAQQMDILYRDAQYREELGTKAMVKFSDPKYSWDTIAETWKQVFLEVLS